MASRVNEIDGVVKDIAVAVEGLGAGRVGDEGVGGDEAGEGGGVVAGVVVEEAEVAVFFLSCEAGVGDGLAGGGAVGAEGLVAGIGIGEFATGAFGQVAGAAEVVGVEVEVAVVAGYGVAGDVDGDGPAAHGQGDALDGDGAFGGGAAHAFFVAGVGGVGNGAVGVVGEGTLAIGIL